MAEDKSGKKMIAVNREVRHEYFVIEALETGIELVGTEVKSLRGYTVNEHVILRHRNAKSPPGQARRVVRQIHCLSW